MADEDRDLERRLDHMFGSARPRPGFEGELWRRIQARRPWSSRLADLLRPALRLAPALAALLVVVVGAGWLVGNFHGGASSSSGTAPRYSGSGVAAAAAFGLLPAPSGPAVARRVAGQSQAGAAPKSPLAADVVAASYRFTGTLPTLPPTFPVYRYLEPSPDSRATAAGELQALTGLAVTVSGSRPGSGDVPEFTVMAAGAEPALATVEATADAFVRAHQLAPGFLFRVTTGASGRSVVYARQFPLGQATVDEVGADGSPAGMVVDLTENLAVARAHGPLNLALAVADYSILAASDALSAAGFRTGGGGAQDILLDSAEVVYVAVPSAGRGYYQPMLLLRGPAARLLVPLVSPRWMAP